MGGKLHELLAVEGDLEGIMKKIVEETTTVFSKKPAHFMGIEKRLRMFDTSGTDHVPQGEEDSTVTGRQELVTTVEDKIKHTAEVTVRYYDAVLQKDATNQAAKGDVIIGGKTIATDLPATFLLGMETKLKLLRKMFDAIPTLPSGIKWEIDENLGAGVYRRAHPEIAPKTAKTFMHKILVEAQFPKEGEGGTSLPAQVEKWEEQINVGEYTTEAWCSMVTPTRKKELIERLDTVIRAFKKARQRANSTKVVNVNAGADLFGYILGE